MKAILPMTLDEYNAAEERRAASGFVTEAFAEALLSGIEPASLAQAAMNAALQELIAVGGEEYVADHLEEIAQRVRNGEFSGSSRH